MFSPPALKFALAFALLPLACAGAEDAPDKAGWKLKAWNVNMELVSTSDPSNPNGQRKMDAGLKLIPESNQQYDASKWLRDAGVATPDGARVIFDAKSFTLVMFAPPEAIESACGLFGDGSGEGSGVDIQIEAALVECALPRSTRFDGWNYPELRKAAGTTWKELEHLTLRTRSGQRAVAETVARNPKSKGTVKPAANETFVPMKDGDRGLQFEVEPVLGPDGYTYNLELDARHHGALGTDGPVLDARVLTAVIAWDGYWTVVTMWSAASAKDPGALSRRVALVVRPRVVNAGGWPVDPDKK
jgi:hypothetical protein